MTICPNFPRHAVCRSWLDAFAMAPLEICSYFRGVSAELAPTQTLSSVSRCLQGLCPAAQSNAVVVVQRRNWFMKRKSRGLD